MTLERGLSDSLRARTLRFVEDQVELFGDIVGSGLQNESTTEAEGIDNENRSDRVDGTEHSYFGEQLAGVGEEWTSATSLDELFRQIDGCTKCKLGATRTHLVFGTGNPDADLMVVGEAPGADEDAKGEPFVGRAGQLLTKILGAIDLRRDDVYIANIIKSRPPGNRRPEPDEIDACIPYLYKQIELVRPKFILALGLTAAKSLIGATGPMKDLRGTVHPWHGIPVVVTYHPAALLRNPAWKRPTWEDVQMLRKLLDDATSP